MRSTLRKIAHRIFRVRFFEWCLVGFLRIFPNADSVRKLAPENTAYPENTFRICRRKGIRYKLYLRDYQCWLLYYYSDQDSSFGLVKHISPGDVIIDVGGNIGQTAMMMALKTGSSGRVFSFEPYPRNYKWFCENLALNPGIMNVVLSDVCLGNSSGVFYMHPECTTNSGGNRIASDPGLQHLQPVEMKRIEDIHVIREIDRLDFIKVDVEGYELQVLRGSAALLKKHHPALFIEVNDANLKKQGDSAVDLLLFLNEKGYRVMDADGKGVITTHDILAVESLDIYCPRPPKG